MRYRLSALGVAVVVAALVLFGALRGPAADGDRTSQSPQPEQNALQEDIATEPALTCSGDHGNRLGMANPAATYCKEMGYEYRITQTNKGEEGICVFPDGGECEEWKFLAGKCGRERSYCAKQGLDQVTKTNGKNPLSREYAVCVDHGEEIGPVSGLMGLSEKATRSSLPVLGSEPPPDQGPVTGTPPSSFDWRNEDGYDWMTSVKNQGSCGSCWAFSTAGVVEGTYNVESGNPDIDLDLSEEYLVSDCYTMGAYGNCCGGTYVDALEFVRDSGIPDEGCMPYVDQYSCTCSSSCDSNCAYGTEGACSDATCSDRCADWQSRAVTIDTVAPVPSGQINQYLVDRGPLAVAMGVGSGYGGGFDAQGVYRCTNDSGANHAVIIAGYSNAGGYWIVKNSWGATWNGDGYFKVGYGECAIETWVYYVDTPASAPSPTPTPTPTSCAGDVDCDGVLDDIDNCPTVYNPGQTNTDGQRRPNGPIPNDWASNPSQDKLGDACDTDHDNDWMLDTGTHPVTGVPGEDVGCGSGPTNPLAADTDGDTVIDGAECALGSDPNDPTSLPALASPDKDGDGLPAWLDNLLCPSDVDGDGLWGDNDPDCDSPTGVVEFTDGWEFRKYGTAPSVADTDGDICTDWIEIVDLDGNRVSNINDVYIVAARAFPPTADPVEKALCDLDGNGVLNINDVYLAAQNSNLVKPHSLCPSEG